MYYVFTLDSCLQVSSSQRLRTDLTNNYSYLVLLIYVDETIYLLGNLPFFKIHVNHFMVRDDSPVANVFSMHVVGEGPGVIL